MMDGMKITIQIDDSLFRGAQLRAVETNSTLDAVAEDAFRLLLMPRLACMPREVGADDQDFFLPVFKAGGEQPGVDLDNSGPLLDRMEGTD